MSKNQDVPRNKDGTPDKRTVEGREAAAKEGDKNYKPANEDVPRNKDGTPDKRTVEGREAASVEGDANKHRETENKTRLDGEVDKRTVEGRQQVHEQKEGEKDHGKSGDKDHGKSGDKDHGKSGEQEHFEEGDNVVFNIGSNNLHGTISRVITKDQEVDGRIAHGSKDDPRYAVKYEGTGVEQIRTESALQKDEGQPTNDAGGKYSERGPASSSPRSTRSNNSSSSSSSSPRRDDRYRKGHKFEEGETVVFHIGKHELHGKIAKVSERSGEASYKVNVGDDTITAKEKDLEKDKASKSGSGSSSSGSSSHGKGSESDHKFEEGDSVTFNIGLNDLHGTITKVITKDTEVDGRIAHGSKDEPRYAVKYEGTGVEQIRTESALKADEDKMDEDKSNKRKREDESKDKKDDVPRNKDGTPDKRTVEGREAAAKDTKEPSPKKSKTK